MTNTTNETLALLKEAQSKPLPDSFAKAFTQSSVPTSGLTYYDLEPGAKLLYPVLTPLRNRIPRKGGGAGTATNWRAVTGINVNAIGAGVSEGNRGGIVTTSTADYTAAYRSLGLEDNVSFEAEEAAAGFDDLRALAAQQLLRALMIGEEKVLLGGLGSYGLGQTPQPTLATATTGGALPATTTYSVICVALSLDGFATASIANGIRASVTRTNADQSTDTYGGGAAQKSINTTIATGAGSANSIAASVTPVPGAVGYAWFWGAAGAEVLGAITSINSVSITAAAAGTQTASSLPAADNSTNALVFDGLLAQIAKTGSNAYYAAQATGAAGTGTPLTADGAGGIVEIDTALKSFWDNYRLSPTDIYVSSQEQQNIMKKILANPAAGAQRFIIDTQQGQIKGGDMVRSYLNKFSMDGAAEIPIHLHPNMPAGTMLFYTDRLPYPLSNVANVLQVKTRRDYYQLEWPMRSRRYEYGVYANEVLQNYFPPAFGMITNIGNG